MYLGYLVAIEGPECSGKSTAVSLLRQQLEAAGKKVTTLVSHHDGANGLAYKQRSLILDHRLGAEMSDTVRALCFAAARRSMVENTILPALERGEWIIVDRWVLSTLAIQRSADNLEALIQVGTKGIIPDFTFTLDIPVELTMSRLAARLDQQDHLDMVSVEEHAARWEVYMRSDSYLDYLEGSPELDIPWVWKIINAANQTPQEIVDSMMDAFKSKAATGL